MKMRYLVWIILASSAFGQTDIGISLAGFGKSSQQRIEVAKQLGASWYRPTPVLLGESEPICPDCRLANSAGMKLAVVVRNGGANGKASSGVGDEAVFKKKLRGVLEQYKPDLLIVEDEPDNQKESFSGTAEEYGAELKAACEVSHSMNVRCANGGLSSKAAAGLVIDQRWKTDRIDAAKFANTIEFTRASGHDPLNIVVKTVGEGKSDLDAIVGAAEKYLSQNRAEIDRARAFAAVVDASGADYFNFHWLELKPDVLSKVADVLHEISKRPLMSDEVGQRSDRAFETGEKIRVLLDNGVRPVIWAAADGKDGVVGLVDGKGKLRPTAAAFQREAQRSK
jgi:hypothetical protein